MIADCTPTQKDGEVNRVPAMPPGTMTLKTLPATADLRVLGLAGFACVSPQLPPWFYVSAHSSPTLGQHPPPVQANPHSGPPDSCSGISCTQRMNKHAVVFTD